MCWISTKAIPVSVGSALRSGECLQTASRRPHADDGKGRRGRPRFGAAHIGECRCGGRSIA
jgi:hypothetical protein